MNDRELLEKAAKAAGLNITWENGQEYAEVLTPFRGHLMNYEPWNPLTDDGDALRLAVKLKLKVFFDTDWDDECETTHFATAQFGDIGCGWPEVSIYEQIEDIDDLEDCLYATRRAITRAAAAMCND